MRSSASIDKVIFSFCRTLPRFGAGRRGSLGRGNGCTGGTAGDRIDRRRWVERAAMKNPIDKTFEVRSSSTGSAAESVHRSNQCRCAVQIENRVNRLRCGAAQSWNWGVGVETGSLRGRRRWPPETAVKCYAKIRNDPLGHCYSPSRPVNPVAQIDKAELKRRVTLEVQLCKRQEVLLLMLRDDRDVEITDRTSHS